MVAFPSEDQRHIWTGSRQLIQSCSLALYPWTCQQAGEKPPLQMIQIVELGSQEQSPGMGKRPEPFASAMGTKGGFSSVF